MSESQVILERAKSIDGQVDLIDKHGKDFLADNPPFTVKDLKEAIPAHCFERSLVTSFSYLGWDVIRAAILFGLGYYVHAHLNLPLYLSIPFWIVYFAVQGTILTGIWVIAHECGHHAFSEYPVINDTVGLIFHSILLVPYFSWRISHSAHHFYTGNIDRDEVHVPYRYKDFDGDELPWGLYRTVSSIFKHLVIGWPAYLVANVASNKVHGDKHVDHFSPWSPLFRKEDRIYIFINDIALLIVFFILGYLSYHYGLIMMLKVYFVPYMIVNAWVVLITKLQHASPDAAYFEHSEWGWLRGQLTTIDRSYGRLLDKTLHFINSTHLVHHIFSKLPFYHAEEATEAIKKVVGPYYRYNDAPLYQQLWNVFSECVFVEKKGRALWFYKGDNKAQKKEE